MKKQIFLALVCFMALVLCGSAAAAAPTADFSATPTSGSAPLNVQFTDLSAGGPTSYAWDFNNDGNVDSTEQNPTHTYNTAGTYTVKLTATNNDGSDEEVKTDYITVNEPPTADVRVKIYTTNGQYTWNEGDTFYTMVDVKNNGPDTATGVQVTNQLPAGLQFLAASTWQGTYDSTTGIWNIGTLTSGQCVVLTIKSQVVTSDTTLQNTVTKTAENEYDPVTSNNVATRTLTINPEGSDIRVKLYSAINQYTWNLGDTFELVVDVKNNGQAATGVQVTNQLPAGLQFIGYTTSQGTYDSNTGVWDIGTLTSGQCIGLHIFVQAINTGIIQDTAIKTALNEYDYVTSNDAATKTFTINSIPTGADIRLKLYPENKQYTWNQGDIIELLVDVKNNGPETATGVQVTNLLPAGLQFVSYFAGQGTYDSNTGIWNIGTLTSGQCIGLHIFVQAITTGTIQDTVTKTALNEIDSVASNDAATTTLTIN